MRTIKTTEQKIKIMQAFLDGKIIESRFVDYPTDWREDEEPIWDWCDCDYRIKRGTSK